MSRKPSKAMSAVMAQPFSTRELRVIVRYLFYQDVDPSEIHKLMTAACGTDAPSYKDVREWIQDLLDGKDEVDNCVCSGGRKLSGMQADAPTDPALVARLEYLINLDIRISPERLAELAITPIQPIQTILTNLLGLKRVCEKWVPRLWTPEAREYRVNVCKELLHMYQEEGISMLHNIIVGDVSFVLYHAQGDNPTSTTSNTKPQKNKFRPSDEPERVYFAFFYDMKGLLVSEALHNKQPLTAVEYVTLLKTVVMPAYVRKRGPPTKPIYLLHSVSPSHNALVTQNALQDLKLKALPNAMASPDLEPLEFWFYRHMKKMLDGHHFNSKPDLWTAVQKHIHSLTDSEYNNSISRLVERWNICIEKQGLYLL